MLVFAHLFLRTHQTLQIYSFFSIHFLSIVLESHYFFKAGSDHWMSKLVYFSISICSLKGLHNI